MTLTIARREWISLFQTPLVWVLLALHQVLLAWVFLRVVERFSGLEAAQRSVGLTQELTLNLFGFAAMLALFSVPLLTMRQFSGEMRDGSFVLLAGAPLSLPQILFGKLLGLIGLLSVFVALPLLLSLSLWPWTALDLGLLLAAVAGLALVYFCFAAIGLFFSILARQPAAAAAGAYALFLGLSLVNRGNEGNPLLNWLAWNEHFLPFLMGLVGTPHVAYFLVLSGLFLSLSLYRLVRRREDG